MPGGLPVVEYVLPVGVNSLNSINLLNSYLIYYERRLTTEGERLLLRYVDI